VNWNILVALGKEIKRDSMIAWAKIEKPKSKMVYKLFKVNGEPSSKAKYNT